MNTEQRQIIVNGLPVVIVRKDIKNLHLGVYPPNGRVRVAAPLVVNDEAVRLAEEAFTTEFARLVSHLVERLSPGVDGQAKVFRDTAVGNLSEFFDRCLENGCTSTQVKSEQAAS